MPVPDFSRLALGVVLDSDATVSDDGRVVGDPTEAALVVLAAKLGVDADETRRAYPRLAEVPFDSEYKFMATFHRVNVEGGERVIELVKGGPDVVLARCARSGGPMSGSHVPIADVRADIDAANERMGEQGLRVLAFAARFVDGDDLASMNTSPMSLTQDLDFVGMVGIIDPLRAEAKDAVQTALGAGIDVRMITGDHAVTAKAIGETLGLGPGAISGSELKAMSDDELARRLPELHVFGRVSPEDKLRLARVMQEQGLIVAMTGDAVNDAAALKQADIGVAMGSGSEVTKQAARMILTDDNFGTLVHAVEIGRRVYDKVVAYVRYQMTQLLGLVMLFVAASAFNINEGVALTPLMVLFLLFFVTSSGVVIIAIDPGDPDVMHRPPRDPSLPITNRAAVIWWIVYGAALFLGALVPLVWGPDKPSVDHASASLTMTFVVMGLGTVFNALTNRRDPGSGLAPPILKALAVALVPVALIVLATMLPGLQHGLMTTPLTGPEWLAAIGLALVLPVVVEVSKWIRRLRSPSVAAIDVQRGVAPAAVSLRARAERCGRCTREKSGGRVNLLVGDLVGPYRHAPEARRSVRGHHGDVERVSPAADHHSADARHVVARVERPPPVPEVGLEPRAEVHRLVRRGNADVGEIAEHVAGRNVEAPAQREAEVREVAAHPGAALPDVEGRGERVARPGLEPDVPVNPVAHGHDPGPTRIGPTEELPRGLEKPVGPAEPAGEQEHHRLVGEQLDGHLPGVIVGVVDGAGHVDVARHNARATGRRATSCDRTRSRRCRGTSCAGVEGPRPTPRGVNRCAESARGRTCQTVGVGATESYSNSQPTRTRIRPREPASGRRFERHHVDRDLQLVVSALRVDHALQWRHVAVVATECIGDVAIGHEPVVRRIEVYPAGVRNEHRRPRVRHVGADEPGLAGRGNRLEVAADVATGEPDGPQTADGQVGEVLAHPLSALEQLGECCAYRGGAGLVREVVVDARREVDECFGERASARERPRRVLRHVRGDGDLR